MSDEAIAAAQTLVESAWVKSSKYLFMEAQNLLTATYRASSESDRAVKSATVAFEFTSDREPGDSQRIEAAIDLVELGAPLAPEALAVLRNDQAHTEDPYISGRAAWCIGDCSFANGQIDEGLSWHETARQKLRPSYPFQVRLDFLYSTIKTRLGLGITDGTSALLDEVEVILAISESTENIGFKILRLQYLAKTGEEKKAMEILETLMSKRDFSFADEAKLNFTAAEILIQIDQPERATPYLLAAARLSTQTQDSDGALRALHLLDSLNVNSYTT